MIPRARNPGTLRLLPTNLLRGEMMGQLTKQFGKIKVEVEIPHLLNLQVDSYRKFMQEGRIERLPDRKSVV